MGNPVRRNLLSPAICALCAGVALQSAAAQQIAIPDVTLFDQNGDKFHFGPAMVQGHVFGIDTIFTTCTTICPLIGARIGALKKELGPSAGAFQMISISVDPAVDTPARLHEWAKQFHAGANWKLLTGPTRDVDVVLKAFGLYSPEKESHSFTMVVGGGASGWTRTSALVPTRDLAALIQTRLKGLR